MAVVATSAVGRVRNPRVGVEQWINPRNGFAVVRLHYSADPIKRDPKWKAALSKNYPPRAWKREYEIDWAAPEGEPVIAEYTEAVHMRPFDLDPRLRLLRFWDFGFDSPVVLFAQLSLEGQLRIRRELCPFNTPLFQLVEAMNAVSLELLGPTWLITNAGDATLDVGGTDDAMPFKGTATAGDLRVFDAGDPAGTATTSLGNEVEILGQLGVHIHTVRPGTEQSYEKLRQRFSKMILIGGVLEPAIVVHPECAMLRQALAGAFHRSPTPPYKPRKVHPFKDLVDALRYGHDNLDAASSFSVGAMAAMARADRQDDVGRVGW